MNSKKDFENLLIPADIFKVICMDERKLREELIVNPVHLPGATYSLIDTVKFLYGYSEEKAWELFSKVGIPLGTHIDDHVSKEGESVGCGYAKLVETCPEKVLAPEAIKAAERLLRVARLGGEVFCCLGEHHAKYAVINHKKGFSISHKKASLIGVFSCDVWAAGYYANYLSQFDSRINGKEMKKHVEKIFRAAVTTLSLGEINEFVVLEG